MNRDQAGIDEEAAVVVVEEEQEAVVPVIVQRPEHPFAAAQARPAAAGEEEQEDDDNEEQQAAVSSSNSNNQFRAAEDLTRILTQNDPERMKLTRQEHEWALRIKENIETNVPELDNLTDFMYAQLALLCQNDDMEDVLWRCHGLQGFQQEYKVILDSVNEACKSLRTTFNIFPELFLSVSFSQKDGTYVGLLDMSKFEPTKNFTSPKMVEDWMRCMWHWHESFCPDFESIRRGCIILSECQEVTMMSRDVLKHTSALLSQFVCYYPLICKVRHYNSGVVMNILISISRQMLPSHMRDNYEVGLKFEGNLRETFLTPTVEEANQRTISMMQENLKRRYRNVKAFTL